MRAFFGLKSKKKDKGKDSDGSSVVCSPGKSTEPVKSVSSTVWKPVCRRGSETSYQHNAKPILPVFKASGGRMSLEEVDSRLDTILVDAIDFLVNEGLDNPELFRTFDPQSKTCEIIKLTVIEDSRIDFVKSDSVSLATSVFMQCMLWLSKPVFPVNLLDDFTRALVNSENIHEGNQFTDIQIVIERSKEQISTKFLSILCLFNLIVLHSSTNRVTVEMLAKLFAPFFVKSRIEKNVADSELHSVLTNAEFVLRVMIIDVYKIFRMVLVPCVF
jgi:hypothetical protein